MARRARNSPRTLLIACASSLLMGACAVQSEQAADAEWYFDGTEFSADTSGAAYAPFGSSTSSGARVVGDASTENEWSQQTYVYRGGRDPKTGIAYDRM